MLELLGLNTLMSVVRALADRGVRPDFVAISHGTLPGGNQNLAFIFDRRDPLLDYDFKGVVAPGQMVMGGVRVGTTAIVVAEVSARVELLRCDPVGAPVKHSSPLNQESGQEESQSEAPDKGPRLRTL